MSKIFFNENGEIILEDGKVILCDDCPCEDCEPIVLGEKEIVESDDVNTSCWNLQEFQKWSDEKRAGDPWRLIEVGANRVYHSGLINKRGQLEGLPSEFCALYTYAGYMELQIGCELEDGTIKFP